MLLITAREGDYIMINGNIKISYERSSGKDGLVLGIEAPKDIEVLRGKVYEERIHEKAARGCVRSRELSRKLSNEYEERRRKYNARRNSRDEQARRAAAGEIKPSVGMTV